jgi:hypothetical protein
MATLTLTIPDQQSKKLQSVDIADIFAQFIEEYLEYQDDYALRQRIIQNERIQHLTKALTETL